MRYLYAMLIVFALVFIENADAMERFDIVTTAELAQMLKERELKKADFLLVNTLDGIIFKDSSIPGSINLPLSQVDEKISILGPDKSKNMVFY